MFSALGRLVSRRPWWVVAGWVVAAIAIVSTAPALESTSDQAEFLPSHYESVKAANLQADAFPTRGETAAIVVVDREDGSSLSADDQAVVTDLADKISAADYDTFDAAVPVPAAGGIQAIMVNLAEDRNAYDMQATEDAEQLRADLAGWVEGTDLRVGVGGDAASQLDAQESGDATLAIVGIVTIVLIIGLLALIFRSVLVCILPILVVALSGSVATGLIGFANEVFDLKADASLEVILFVVLYGIGTDYILFFVFRYREALRLGMVSREAVAYAVHRAGEAIASAGGAVVVAFSALALSSLGMFRAMGPALAIAVAVTVVAALTLVPAFASIIGNRALAWPSKSWLREPKASRFRALGGSVGRKPAVWAASSAVALAVLALFAISFNPTFDLSSSSDQTTESAVAMKKLTDASGAGAAAPATVLLKGEDGVTVDEAATESLATAMASVEGVESATSAGATGEVGIVQVVLADDPYSDTALDNVAGPIRDAAHAAAPEGTTAYVGGITSIFADFESAMNRDYSIVFPVAGVLIMVILGLLLRSVVAPWYLMAAVGLGFAASIGATTLVFQHIVGDDGIIFMLPIMIYLFVVALGTDYNILMVARLREEAREGRDPHAAAAKAIEHAGPTVAAAGVILAGTFASLMLAPDSTTKAMGFSFSTGIALAAFVMALLLTPALTALIGHKAWWPGHGDEPAKDAAPVDRTPSLPHR